MSDCFLQGHVPRDDAVNAASQHSLSAASGVVPPGVGREMSIPKEIWRLVDGIWTGGGISENDLFIVGADPGKISTSVRV